MLLREGKNTFASPKTSPQDCDPFASITSNALTRSKLLFFLAIEVNKFFLLEPTSRQTLHDFIDLKSFLFLSTLKI